MKKLIKIGNIQQQVKPKEISLRLVLTVPFLLLIFAAVGITGYLSFRNGRNAVNDLALKLTENIAHDIENNITNYLEKPQNLHQTIIATIESQVLDLEDFDSVEKFFWHQIQINLVPDVFFANSKGEIIGVSQLTDGSQTVRVKDEFTEDKRQTFLLNSLGNRTKLLQSKEYNTIARPWYQDVIRARKQTWTQVYPSTNLLTAEISLVTPFYNKTGELKGIVGSELTLGQIDEFLKQLEISKSGEAFLLERNGELVASSTPEPIFKVVDGEEKQILAQNSPNPLIRSTARYLFDKSNNFEELENRENFWLEIDGKKSIVQINSTSNIQGIDFLIVVVVPESDFVAEINASNRHTILLCIASLSVATLLGIITSGWITRPIRRLSNVSHAIADGDLEQQIKIKGISELEVLANSFNQMTSQLKSSFTRLDTTNQELAKINAELDLANRELDDSNKELENRVEERTKELQVSKEQAEKAQQIAEVANKAKSTFLANMSHELRTPLNAILGFSQIMQRDRGATRSQKENLAIINRSGEHLLALINDVLDLSKIEAGRISLNPSSFDLHRLLDTTEEMLELKADAQRLQLLFERHPDTPQYISTDERKLSQVLLNLLNNAIKFTTEGGVTLRVKPDTTNIHNLLFEIEDTGAGIAPEELDTLFEVFTQTESGRKSEEGTGLGLAISRKFVQLMRGDITVSSKLEEGTVFKFNIVAEPAIEDELQPQKSVKQVIGLEPNQPNYRILIVDDRWENRQIVLKLLESIGFELKEAVNGKEAIAIWEQWQPHLIWMDMRMPVMNGYEATEYIKSHLKGQATYIIALTASTFEEERAIVLSTGCDDFVRKPFREAVLFDKMAEYLGVRYVYAENNESSAIQTHLVANFLLEPTSLQVMPREWLTQLQEAASKFNKKLILKLLNQIPDEHNLLAQVLQNKANNFDFDEIVDSVQQTLSLNKQ